MRAQGSGDHQRGDGPTPAAVSGRRLTLGTVSLLALMLTAVVTPGRAAGEIAFDIPGGDLGGVLARIGRTGSTSISFPADLTRGRRSGPIVGSMSVQEALSRALAGTGLVIASGPGGVLMVRAAGPAPTATGTTVAGDIAAIDVVDTNAGSPFGDRGFQAGDAGAAVRIADAPIKEVPIAIDVVTNQVIRSQVLTNSFDAVRNTPGIVAIDNGVGPGGGAPRFQIRGFDTPSFTINGQRNSLAGIPIDGIERVEVTKGPASLLNGSDEGGGSVNLVTKRPTAETIRELTVRYGQFNYKTLALDLGGAAPDWEGMTYRFVGSANHADQTQAGYRDPHEFFVAPSVQWQGQDLTVLGSLIYTDQRTVARPRFAYLGRETDDDDNLIRQGIFRATGVGLGNPRAGFDVSRLILNSEQTYHVGRMFDMFDVTIGNVIEYSSAASSGTFFTTNNFQFGFNQFLLQQNSAFSNQNLSERPNITFKYQDEILKNNLKIGYDYIDQTSPSNFNFVRSSPFSGQVSYLTGLPRFPLSPINTDPINRTNTDSTLNGIYMIDKLDLFNDRLHLLGSVRYDENSVVERFNAAGQPRVVNTQNRGTSYVFGAVLDITQDWSVYLNRSEGISFLPLSNGRVIPPEGRQLSEVGFKNQLFDKRFSTTVSAFELIQSNLTVEVPGVDDQPNGILLITGGGLRSRGFEFSGQGEILPGWNMIASATRLWIEEITPNPVIDITAGRSAYSGSVWTTYTWQTGWLDGFTAGFGVRAVSGFKVNATATSEFVSYFDRPGYGIADALISYQHGDFSADLKINNIFDKQAIQPSLVGNYLPFELRRNALLTMRYRF